MKKWLKHLNLFRPNTAGPESVLGDLEAAVMEACWALGEFGIKDVHGRLAQERTIAYTTVQTTIDRLYRKGMLRRLGRGRSFVYSPAVSRDEFMRGVTRHVLDALFGHFAEPTMAALVDVLHQRDPAEAERLLREIEARRAAGER